MLWGKGSVMVADPDPSDRSEVSRETPVRPYETPEFHNSVEYTIAVTFVVAGGARWGTAYRRARRIVERLANTAARAKGVVDVKAIAGASQKGEMTAPERVCFEAANAGRATNADPTKLDRYLDPDHQLALAALAQDNAAARARIRADQQRRAAVGCTNPWQNPAAELRSCACVYCQPAVHLDDLDPHWRTDDAVPPRCACGRQYSAPRGACAGHREHRLVLLDRDPAELERLAALWPHHPSPERPGPDGRDGREEPGLPPPGR